MAHKNNWFTAPFLDGDFSVRKLYVYQRDPEGRPWNEGTPWYPHIIHLDFQIFHW